MQPTDDSTAALVPGERERVRAAARRRRAQRGAAISAISTVVVLGLAVLLVVTSPGWERVQDTFFSWEAFRRSAPEILRGFWLDVRIFLATEVIVLLVGLGVAVLRVTRTAALFPFRLLASIYVDVGRGLPTLLLVFLIGFGVPALQFSWLTNDPVLLGAAALALSYGAYVAEVFRAGIESVHPSQRAAARALGLSQPQTLRHVVLPQAIRRVVPPLLNDFISLQKDVALIATLGPLTALRNAQIDASQNFNYTPYVAAGVLYLLLTIPLARLTDRLQARSAARRGQGGAT